MSFATIRALIPMLVTLSLPAVATAQQAQPSRSTTPAVIDPPPSTDAKDSDHVADLMRSLETTLEQLNRSRLQAVNVRKVLETIDSGAVKATQKERLKTNQFVRKQLTKEFRELRVRSRSTLTEIHTGLLPKQRGLTSKLRARWDLAEKASTKDRIGRLLADYEQTVVETEEQVRHLESGIGRLDAAIRILEEQLSYLDLVEETLELGREVATRLQELNREIDQVVNALIERESQQ
jgi:exonuclease VII small subunit